MKILTLIVVIGTLFIMSIETAMCQTISPDVARAELARKGLDEEEVTKRMLAKGVDLSAIDQKNPAEVAEAERVLQEVIAEMEAEKKQESVHISTESSPASLDTNKVDVPAVIVTPSVDEILKQDEIIEAVEEGATIEETISEEVEEAASQFLRPTGVYGKHLFRDNRLKIYRQADNIKPPDTYILGPRDEIIVNIWGISEESASFEINDEGYIKPSRLPRIYITGLSIKRAKLRLRDYYSNYYQFRNEDFEVTIATARILNINIYGESNNVGTFSISAVNSAFNALVAGGGPNEIGSVRKIKLMRAGQTLLLDVYQFLNDPSIQNNFQLQDNDIIFIPIAEKIVTINGAVKRPLKYELLESEHLIELIDYCGGITDRGLLQNIQVIRLENGEEKIINFSLKKLLDSNRNYKLKSGDVIKINSFTSSYRNFVKLTGAVEVPGDYEFVDSIRLIDVLSRTKLLPDALLDSIYIRRINPDRKTFKYLSTNLGHALGNPNSDANITLRRDDVITIFRQGYFSDAVSMTISGHVRNPGKFDLDKIGSLRISDVVILSGGLKDAVADIAYLYRRDLNNPNKIEYIEVNVVEVVKNVQSPDNRVLKPGDNLRIFSRSRYSDEYEVSISGAVREPNTYKYDPTLKINDLLILSGGLTTDAIDSAYIIGKDLSNPEKSNYRTIGLSEIINNPISENNNLYPGDRVIIYTKQRFSDQYNVSISGAVREPNTYNYDPTLRINDLLILSGGLTTDAIDTAYIIGRDLSNPEKSNYRTIRLSEIINNPSSNNNNLFPGDQVIIYTKQRYSDQYNVSISGAVREPNTYNYDPTLRINDLVILAGGLREDALDFGYIFRRNKVNPKSTVYIRVDIKEIMNDPTSVENIPLEGGDRLVLYSINRYVDDLSLTIGGAVREPETYKYDPSLKIQDVVVLAGGLKFEASPKRVEIFRIEFSDEKETQTLAATLSIDESGNVIGNDDFVLQPFDRIYVRTAPEFELQRMVNISGEVRYPGSYALLDDNEPITSLIERAGGFTREAFLGGATLNRSRDNIGYVIIDLKKAMSNTNSEQNLVLHESDNIIIPKIQSLVSIVGATRADELYPNELIQGGKFNVPFEKGKNAKYYIKKYAGGIGEKGSKSLVSVYYPNGEIQKSNSFLFFRSYPNIKPGAEIRVGVKPIKPKDLNKTPKGPVDWERIVGNTIAQATSVLTLILLVQRLD